MRFNQNRGLAKIGILKSEKGKRIDSVCKK